MKKMFLLIALLFSVVCYAAPPPDKESVYVAADVGYVIQDIQIVNVAEIDLFAIELPAQEVAFIDIGNTNENYGIYSIKNYNYLENKQNTNYGYPLTGDKQFFFKS